MRKETPGGEAQKGRINAVVKKNGRKKDAKKGNARDVYSPVGRKGKFDMKSQAKGDLETEKSESP